MNTITAIPFVKMHGLGNDFILAEAADFPANTDWKAMAVKLCDRHFGIGADGLILRYSADAADHRMQIVNSDGSEAEMCGNGLRCFVRYLREKQGERQSRISIETGAGVLQAEWEADTGFVHVDMGQPVLEASQIPATGFSQSPVVLAPLEVEGQEFSATLVSMGNPHCVIFVSDVEAIPLSQLGPRIETLPHFPRKTNVEFVAVKSPGYARVRVWERGAGITLACGTGACAVLVAGVLNGLLEPQARIKLPGGSLQIRWDRERNRVTLSGPATFVFEGMFELGSFAG